MDLTIVFKASNLLVGGFSVSGWTLYFHNFTFPFGIKLMI